MGKRFKDKRSIKAEKKQKKLQIKEEKRKQKIGQKLQVENIVGQVDEIEQVKKVIEQVDKIEQVKQDKKIEKKAKKKTSAIQGLISILIVIIILIIPIIDWKQNKNIIENIITNTKQNAETNQGENTAEIVDADIPETMGEYGVLGKIVIDKIGVEKNILDQTTDASLKLSVTKFYGPNINEEGNLCISGHNYKDTFGYLDKMEKGDTFYLINKTNFEKVTYKVYDKFTVNATELDCLDQETGGKREVTLITCNPGGVTRLIIKAQEI